jgi:hypothetical protein
VRRREREQSDAEAGIETGSSEKLSA